MRKMCILVRLLLLLPPVCGQDLRTDNFIHQTDKKNWGDAQAFCRSQHTDLVTIEDEINNQYFKVPGWIGLYRSDSTSNWKWSSGNEIATFTNWDTNEPQDDENCAFKDPTTGKWSSDPCSVLHTYTCCDERLILVTENKTWEEALKYCRALKAVDPSSQYQNHLYDLATLLTEDDHVFAREKAQGATTDEVWTGLRYLAGQWLWVGGGGQVQYTDIKSCPTQTHCGILQKNGTALYDLRDCSQTKNFFCYKTR